MDKNAFIRDIIEDEQKYMSVNIAKAIDIQFEQDYLEVAMACGMSKQDVVNYISYKRKKLAEITESLEIACGNLEVFADEVQEMFGGNYNE